jgi:putative hydrolase of the HAD superfamily
MTGDIDAVAFDLDGTLYPNYRFYAHLIPFVVREHRLLRAFGKARNILRACLPDDPLLKLDFYEAQARVTADILDEEAAFIQEKIEKLIYRGWEPFFKKVRLFPFVIETLAALKKHNFKVGLLSDFPAEQKLKNLSINDLPSGALWDTVLCSEEIGRLKPDPKSFFELAERLHTSIDRVLYVGNSVRYDVGGAKNAGMKTALKTSFLEFSLKSSKSADFTFHDYRQLCSYVIK